jgi:hypothetical protein
MKYTDLSPSAVDTIASYGSIEIHRVSDTSIFLRIAFDNGYTVELIKNHLAMNGNGDLWEVVTYSNDSHKIGKTPISLSRMGGCSESEVVSFCRRVTKLKGNKT